ncbi:hypothetical protein [Microbispora sp. NBRC 16548]|uniref:hypothetical protein n=1 Tax=Microbispora sp. NBRC 16548 TaxID=3030994 RepID=UPI00161A2F28|nr:hypothetical protein [Microbispora sp. NBRC 16548]GLX06725.1 hypothetical protein Misp03_36520 [Microbispora sp. NBRC 16548]
MSTDPISREMGYVAIALNGVYQAANGCGMDRMALQDAMKAIAEAVYDETPTRDAATAKALQERWLNMCQMTAEIREV